MATKKKCTKCGTVKPLEEFHKDRYCKSGRCSRCKVCVKERKVPKRYKPRTSGLKTCPKCGQSKSVKEFSKCVSRKDGLQRLCAACCKEYYLANKEHQAKQSKAYRTKNRDQILARNKAYRIANREMLRAKNRIYSKENSHKQKAYRESNKEKIADYHRDYHKKNSKKKNDNQKKWYQENKEYALEYRKAYGEKHKERIKKRRKAYYEKNKEAIRSHINSNQKERRANDPVFKLKTQLRTRLNKAIVRNQKAGSAIRNLGCSVEYLKAYLESQFYADENGVMMTWENWGKVWEIDHIYPLAAADLMDRMEFLAVNNWRNLQPLTVTENGEKWCTVYPEALALFRELVAMFEAEEKGAA